MAFNGFTFLAKLAENWYFNCEAPNLNLNKTIMATTLVLNMEKKA